MSIRTIIGLAGRAGSGKDTAAGYLREAVWTTFPQDSICVTGFAARLKQALGVMFAIDFAALSRTEKEARLDWIGKSPRELMQSLGTEWGRGIDPDLWVKLMERQLFDEPRCGRHSEVVLLTDVRFPNEVAWIRRKGGVTWWVERDGIAPVARHASENSIGPADCDRTIVNLGTKEDLAVEVLRAWNQHAAAMEVES